MTLFILMEYSAVGSQCERAPFQSAITLRCHLCIWSHFKNIICQYFGENETEHDFEEMGESSNRKKYPNCHYFTFNYSYKKYCERSGHAYLGFMPYLLPRNVVWNIDLRRIGGKKMSEIRWHESKSCALRWN